MLDPREPTIGAWVNYGLASMSDDLPRFVNMGPRFFDVRDGHYLGPAYDAVNLKVDPQNPLAFARPESDVSDVEQAEQFCWSTGLMNSRRRSIRRTRWLLARIRSYELAYRMQRAVPAVLKLEEESEATRTLYGLDQPH